MKLIFLLTQLLAFMHFGLSQEMSCSEEILLPGHLNMKMVGESKDHFFLATDQVNLKQSTIYKYDKKMKLVSTGEVDVKFKSGTGAGQTDFSKELFYFGGNILAIYLVKEGKTAVLYCDIIDEKSFLVKSKKKMLFKHHYSGMVNVRDFIEYKVQIKNDRMTFFMHINGLISMTKEGNHQVAVLQIDSQYEQQYLCAFAEKDVGQSNMIKERHIFQANDNSLYFYSRVYRTSLVTETSENEFYFSKVDNKGVLTSKKYSFNGVVLEEFDYNFVEIENDVFLVGKYGIGGDYIIDERKSLDDGLFYLKYGDSDFTLIDEDLINKTRELKAKYFNGVSALYTDVICTVDKETNEMYFISCTGKKEEVKTFMILRLNLTSGDTQVLEIETDYTSNFEFNIAVVDAGVVNAFMQTNDDIDGSIYQLNVNLENSGDVKWDKYSSCENVSRHVIIRNQKSSELREIYFLYAKVEGKKASVKTERLGY